MAQPGVAQEGSATAGGGVGWVGPRDERFRGRFEQLLLAVPTRDLPAGWHLAIDLGRPAVPLLWDMVQAEKSNAGRRLAMEAAAVLAGGTNEDERLFAWLDNQKAMLEERVLAALLMALGPRRARGMPNFWSRCHGPDKSAEQILRIAARLAAARFPGTENGAPTVVDEDPGLAGACAYAGLPVSAPLATRLWNLGDPARHADLYWRGVMLCGARQLGDGAQAKDELVQRARDLMALPGEHNAATRAAATLLRMRARDLRADGPRLDWRLLQVAVGDTHTAKLLHGWLGPTPQLRDREEPQRLAVAYVLSRNAGDVVADRAVWSADARIRKHVAVALAWSLLGSEAGQRIDEDVAGLAEWCFVQWAAGGTIDAAIELDDAQLQVAARAAAAGRVSRQVLRSVLEEAMWRWGSHPGLAAWELERLLLRDLLLVGSNLGGGKYLGHVRPEQRYRPTGIGPDDVFFDVAVPLFEFLAHPRSPMPLEHRLR